ncbi:aminotransferase class I/II-fold pyridoxal phosphate-dependent enzyme [Nigerium massiliense]|uniref:aminotransferase class I/II-fold pyridoxal phosphate-dependent enzyme n=1 Tax=Nigerium massiliense TaxID=1522317 RepID=UPI0021C356FD|nr:aminotransferase class I/II-fold pyridoxal phosphate-dependent enzyme [Nigerium massiliense]
MQVTSGSQEGLSIVAQTLLAPGDVVLVEQPTYLAALQAFHLTGADIVPVATDDDGVLPDDLEAKIAEYRPKFVYLIPTFQNPTGRTMPQGAANSWRRRCSAPAPPCSRTTPTANCASTATPSPRSPRSPAWRPRRSC